MIEGGLVALLMVAVAVTMLVNALGAWVWARALREVINARANRNQVQTEELVTREAESALDGAQQTVRERRSRMTDADLASAVQYESAAGEISRNGVPPYPTTDENDGYAETYGPDGIYRAR